MVRNRAGRLIERTARHVPGLRRIPVVKLLALAEIALIAHDHVTRLEAHERRRVLELVRAGRGRRRNLSAAEQDELRELVGKAQPRLFVGEVVDKLSPVRLPQRLVRGPARRSKG